MDKLKQDIKHGFDRSLPSRSVFSEEEKEMVRNRITSINQKSSKKRNVIPNSLTAMVAAGVLLFLGGIVGSELDLFTSKNSGAGNVNIKDNQPLFYEQFPSFSNGWELTNGDEESVEYSGNATITGSLIYHEESHPHYASKVIFYPNEVSTERLPQIDTNEERMLLFDNENTVIKVFGLQPGANEDNITIEIENYIIRKATNLDSVQFINVVIDDGKDKNSIDEEKPVKPMVDENNVLVLSEDLLVIYQHFVDTKDVQLLEGLTPMDVFLLYFYAEEQQDYETQYSLFIDDEENIKVFKTFEDYREMKMNSNSALLEKVKTNELEEVIVDERHAYISISKEDGLGFGLTKNKNGVWRVNWSPTQ